MLKLVDSHDLKSCGFSRPSSSLGEATLRSKLTVNKKQFIYDNDCHIAYRIRYEEKKGSSWIDCKNIRLKILATCGVPV